MKDFSALDGKDDSLISPEMSTSYVPGWWVKSYEGSEQRRNSDIGASPLNSNLRMIPTASAAATSFLGMILDLFMRKMTTPAFRATRAVQISWDECLKYVFTGTDVDRVTLREAFEGLGAICLIEGDEHRRRALPLFEESFYEKAEKHDPRWNFKIGSRTQELIVGLIDGHADIRRALLGIQTSSAILLNDPPLSLWRPAWQELRGSERLLYLNLEKAMQWKMALLHLEGVFSADIEDLFLGVETAIGMDAVNDCSPLIKRLRLLSQVGCTLVEHGVMRKEADSNFYACSENLLSGLPTIIWQGSSQRLNIDAEVSLVAQVFEQMRLSSPSDELFDLWSAVAPRATTVGIDVKRLWSTIAEQRGGILRIGPTKVLQAHNLFFEWALRRPALSDFPLSEELRTREVFAVCRLQGDIVSDFKRFLGLLSEPSTATLFAENQNLTIGQLTQSNESGLFLALRDTIQRKNASHTVSAIEKYDQNRADSSNSSSSFSPAATASQTEVSQARLLNLAESKMIRIAHDELEKMFKSDIRAYESLRDNYLKSLEDSQRSLMQDFQRRMKPNVFEQQLKQRLVRYMVAHPGEWKSSRASLQ